MICVGRKASKYKSVIEAAKNAAILFEDKRFWNTVAKENFEMSDLDGEDIAALVTKYIKDNDVTIKLYRPWNPWAKALAKFSSKTPNCVYLNSRKLRRSNESISGSIVHEIVHLVDYAYVQWGFGHAGNSSAGKKNTVPYKIGRMAKNWVKKYV